MSNQYISKTEMIDIVKKAHSNEVEKFNLPSWLNFDCPICKSSLQKNAIREVGLKLNSRNIGDIVVEFYCENCSRLESLYYKSEAETISDFIKILSGEKSPISSPLLEEDMYLKQYNNLIEKMNKR